MDTHTLNTKEAAEILKVKVSTLQQWLYKDKFDIRSIAYKIGGVVIFYQSEFHDWIREHRMSTKKQDDEAS